MFGIGMKAATARKLTQLLSQGPGAAAGRSTPGGGVGRRPALVRCTSATPAGDDGVAAECYPGVIVDSDPAEPAADQPTLGDVWLTLLGDDGAAVPAAGRVYTCLLAGEYDPTPEGGDSDPRPRAFAQTEAVAWVKVTGDEPDDDGWWEGVVSVDAAGEWTDLTRTVLVSAADGSDLATDTRYLCTRTGDSEDGTARFRAPAQFEFEYTPPDLLSGSAAVSSHAVSADYAWEDTGTEITLPAAGTYLLWGRVLGMGWVNKDADPTAVVEIPTTNPSLHARLVNGSTAVSGTTVTVYVVYLTRDRQYHSASFTATFTVLAATTLKLQVFGVGPPTGYSWDNQHGLSTGAFEDGRVGYVRLTGVDLTPLPDPGDGEAGGTYP